MRILATICFSFALGIFLAQYILPLSWLLPMAAAFALLALLLSLILKEMRRLRMLLILIPLAVSLCYDYAYISLVQLPNEALVDTEQTLTLKLCDYADETSYGAKATVRILDRGLHGKAVYYGSDDLLSYAPGQRISARVYINSAAMIHETDITTFTSKGVYLLLYHRGGEMLLPEQGGHVRYLPKFFARRTQETISAVFSDRTEPFMRAILLGDRSALSAEDWTFFSEAGILHITAVSGLHCALLLSILTFLIGRRRQKLLFAAAVPVLIFYTLMVGATPSIVRSCIMIFMVLLAPLFDRENDAPTALSLSLALILLANPFAAASVGLQLSLGAMAGILWLTPKLYAVVRRKDRPRWQYAVLGSFAVTAGAIVFTAPLSAYYFGILPIVSPISNLLCLWAASAAFALGLVCTMLAFLFMPLAQLAAFVPQLITLYLLTVCRLLTGIPYHALYFSNNYLKYWLVYVYAMLGACCVSKRGQHRYAIAAILSIAALALTVCVNALPFAHSKLHIVVLDVGQGQSIILHSGEQTALIDCGSSNSFLNAGDIAADYLQSIGESELDSLILTHYHADHMNGVRTLLSRIAVNTLYMPDVPDKTGQRDELLALAEQYDIAAAYSTDVTTVPLGGASLTLYPPVGEKDTNEACQSVVCTSGSFDMLVTADMGSKTEKDLLESYTFPDIEVLLVGHHGAKSSTSARLLQAVTPEVGIISVGSNSYGHPTDAALYRLTDEKIAVYRTDLQGNIHITVN